MAVLTVRASADNTTKTVIHAGKHEFIIDEPEFFGGEDLAPSPVEYLLASLAGALNAIGQYVAKELKMDLRGLEIRIEGDCSADRFFGKSREERAGFREIRIRLSADCTADEKTKELWKRNVLSRCPVLDNLRSPAEIKTDISFVSK